MTAILPIHAVLHFLTLYFEGTTWLGIRAKLRAATKTNAARGASALSGMASRAWGAKDASEDPCLTFD
ncbi:hypothetical protein Q5P01_020286 [Channa striata]|uniref:Uncharacterized protein n=1 Tax=Channa striata TaxID=64152 RepID=A0AA88S144_CHASR|nr:hypothetical protein Q5P01_020286 [Channa striata]